MKFKSFSLALLTTLTAITLVGCGGGGGGSSATPLTPATQAPAASTGPATNASDISTELAGKVAIGGYSTLSIAAVNGGTVKTTASIFNKFKTILASFFIKPAIAQSTNTCQTDAYKLVGVGSDGSLTPLPVTQGADACNVGFREMFDAGSYILLTGEGIYKNDLTCNLVFLQKSTGNLFCVGENAASRYQIIATTGSGSGPAQTSTSVAEKIQTIISVDGATNYVLVNAQSTTFDSNNQISGLKTKLLRFDLTDTAAGPKAAVLQEGYQSGWSTYNSSTEFEYFNLDNYRLATNGDVLTAYYLSVYVPGQTGTANNDSYRRNIKYFYDFSADGSEFKVSTLRDNDPVNHVDILTKLNAAMPAQQVNNQGMMGGSSNAITWLNITCMFDSPANTPNGILITVPTQSWVYGTDPLGYTVSTWSQSSSIFRVSRPDNNSGGKPVITFVKPSLLCSNVDAWSGNLPQKVGNAWYTMQRSSYWGYESNGGGGYNYVWGERKSIIGNSLTNTTNNVNDDVVFTLPSTGSGNSVTYYYGMDNTKIKGSKDYLYLLKQSSGYMPGVATSNGIEISRFKPDDQTSGRQLTGIDTIIPSSQRLSVSAFTTSKKDNIVEFVGRDMNSDDLDKVYGTISEDGVYTPKNITTTKYSTIAIVKL